MRKIETIRVESSERKHIREEKKIEMRMKKCNENGFRSFNEGRNYKHKKIPNSL